MFGTAKHKGYAMLVKFLTVIVSAWNQVYWYQIVPPAKVQWHHSTIVSDVPPSYWPRTGYHHPALERFEYAVRGFE